MPTFYFILPVENVSTTAFKAGFSIDNRWHVHRFVPNNVAKRGWPLYVKKKCLQLLTWRVAYSPSPNLPHFKSNNSCC